MLIDFGCQRIDVFVCGACVRRAALERVVTLGKIDGCRVHIATAPIRYQSRLFRLRLKLAKLARETKNIRTCVSVRFNANVRSRG